MIRERLYGLLRRVLGRAHETHAFFVPSYVLVLNWEVIPHNDRELDVFDVWLTRVCPHGVSVKFEKSAAAESWLTNTATNYWGIHQGEGPGGPEKSFWIDVPDARFYMRDPNTAFEMKIRFG